MVAGTRPAPAHRWVLVLPAPNNPGSCGWSACKPLVLSELVIGCSSSGCVDWRPKHPPPPQKPSLLEEQLSTGGSGLVEEAADAAAGGRVEAAGRTLAGSSRWRRCMGPGPTSGHWPRATAGGPSSWREKGQVTQSELGRLGGGRETGNRGRGGDRGSSRTGFGEKPEPWAIWWIWG